MIVDFHTFVFTMGLICLMSPILFVHKSGDFIENFSLDKIYQMQGMMFFGWLCIIIGAVMFFWKP